MHVPWTLAQLQPLVGAAPQLTCLAFEPARLAADDGSWSDPLLLLPNVHCLTIRFPSRSTAAQANVLVGQMSLTLQLTAVALEGCPSLSLAGEVSFEPLGRPPTLERPRVAFFERSRLSERQVRYLQSQYAQPHRAAAADQT